MTNEGMSQVKELKGIGCMMTLEMQNGGSCIYIELDITIIPDLDKKISYFSKQDSNITGKNDLFIHIKYCHIFSSFN